MTSFEHHPFEIKTNGMHDDLLLPLQNVDPSSHPPPFLQPQRQSSPPPFYLLSQYPIEQPPTGSTNLIEHFNLKRDFEKYCNKQIKPSLRDFLPNISYVDTAQLKDDANSGTLRALLVERIIVNPIVPLTETQLLSFRLQKQPYLPEQYQIFTMPRETRSTTTVPLTTTTDYSQQQQQQPQRISPDVKRKASSSSDGGGGPVNNPVLVNKQTISPYMNGEGLLGRMTYPVITPSNANNINDPNNDQDDVNLNKRKTKKTKKDKRL
ncbi:unnamed protein product [Didymodactylos carnosus]|uniref:Mediator of RNA polymerase II transcription subunit 19 n=1 Tax=Didymodactylos carnosus TaxID=1234261 RepID=A0A813WQW8_9BILA|nr:unnamed protein product [Didymodactylos carnosus]CAF0900787.1 unnamed protein product [Didymodactylos carnosus]CAF3644997.1 unnamed protein product [Didymodactylos carnosus]CAF3681504.1 unnamed protein product [Didymodactylos carnosus]